MGEKLAAVLLQFPPQFTAEHAGRLEQFLATVPAGRPAGGRAAKPDLGMQRTLAMLRSHRCALGRGGVPDPAAKDLRDVQRPPLRPLDRRARAFTTHTEERIDVSESLAWWKTELQRVAPEVKSIDGFFNNDYAGYGVGTCNRFKAMLGLPVREPKGPAQGELFGA